MEYLSMILVVLGLCVFETISSIDNAVINAEVLGTMQPKYRRRFLIYGIFFAVFVIRGLLPWLIIWFATPGLGPIGALTATFSNDPKIHLIIEQTAPILLVGGGIFLIFLFFHWLFIEPKTFGLKGEKFFQKQGARFYAVISIILCVIVWYGLEKDVMMGFGAVVGSTAFFITHGFKNFAEESEKRLTESKSGNGAMSDISKILYLEIIDATFSIDGVLGAFAFTLSVPLILLGNGLGAIVVRQVTIHSVEKIKKYVFLKNGAMYSILFLGSIMVAKSFGYETPERLSPIVTFGVIGYFFWKSKVHIKKSQNLI